MPLKLPIPSRLVTARGPELLFSLVVAGAWILVWPVGEYAVNDDWAYVRSLEMLLREGHPSILDWNPMSLVGQLICGVLVCSVIGFSFTSTKIAGALLAWLAGLASICLLRACGVHGSTCFWTATAVFLNPLYFATAFTFHTDVPAAAWQTMALAAWVNALRAQPGRRRLGLVAGAVASTLALLTRQGAVATPASFALYVALHERGRWKPRDVICAFGPVLAGAMIFGAWYYQVHRPTAAFREASQLVMQFAAHPPWDDLPEIIFDLVIYLGILTLPISLACWRGNWQWPAGRAGGCCALLMAAIVALGLFSALENRRVFPYIWNVVTPHGYFRPGDLILGNRDLLWDRAWGWLVSGAALASLLAFVNRLCASLPGAASLPLPGSVETSALGIPHGSKNSTASTAVAARRLLSCALALQWAYFLFTSPLLFDRHLIVLAPIGCCLAALSLPRRALGLGWRPALLVVPMAAYSILCAHDLHAQARTAFLAAGQLVDQGVDPIQVNGGYAFDGWHTYHRLVEKRPAFNAHNPWWRWNVWIEPWTMQIHRDEWIQQQGAAWWFGAVRPMEPVRFAVATSPAPRGASGDTRFTLVRTHPYRQWWPYRTAVMYVYEIERRR